MDMFAGDRWILFEGCHNFRDLGGYRTAGGRTVARRRLFRSGNPAAMTAADRLRLREELGVRTVVDLRHRRELGPGGGPVFGGEGLRWLHRSLNRLDVDAEGDAMPDRSDLGAVYLWIARGVGPVVADLLRDIVEADALPLLFHCAAGKDRTGILAAIVLGILGVPDSVIVEDYALTELARRHLPAADLEAAFRYVRERGLPEATMHARPASMAAFLEGLRQAYGGPAGYAAAHGVADETVACLRERLLDPVP